MNIGSWWSRALARIYEYIQQHGTITIQQCQFISAAAWTELDMNKFEGTKQHKDFGAQFGAITMMDSFYEAHIQHDMRKYKIVSAESGFGLKGEILVGENDRVVVHWVGKPDLTVLDGHRLCPLDHKTVNRIDGDTNSKYKPHPQIAGYIFAAGLLAKQVGLDVSVDRAIINVCARKAPTEKPRDGIKRPRYLRVVVAYNELEIQEWQLQTLNKVTALRRAIEANSYLWNETRCHDIFWKPCQYRGICSNPPGTRPVVIQSNYDLAERWIPYSVQEEEAVDE